MERSIKVVDFTHGKKDSDNVDTNIPFKKNFAEAKTIQSANVVIASYTNKNITDLAKLENKTNVLESDLNNLNNETNVLKANVNNLKSEINLKADKTEIPTKTSELFNDSGYITNDYHDATKQDVINNLGVINNNLKFSLNEIVVGEYLNKPLYRKVIEATVNANTTLNTKLSDLGITGQDIVLIDLGKSIAKYGASPNFGWSPVSYYISGSDNSVVYINTVGSLVIKNNTNGSRDYKVVLEYTKIADSEVV